MTLVKSFLENILKLLEAQDYIKIEMPRTLTKISYTVI